MDKLDRITVYDSIESVENGEKPLFKPKSSEDLKEYLTDVIIQKKEVFMMTEGGFDIRSGSIFRVYGHEDDSISTCTCGR